MKRLSRKKRNTLEPSIEGSRLGFKNHFLRFSKTTSTIITTPAIPAPMMMSNIPSGSSTVVVVVVVVVEVVVVVVVVGIATVYLAPVGSHGSWTCRQFEARGSGSR